MRELPPGLTGTFTLTVERHHTADALGNLGVTVLATPYVVWMVEAAARTAIHPYLDPDEGVAGTHIDCYHTAPAAIGSIAVATVILERQDRARLTYTFRVTHGEKSLAHGTYESMVLPLAKLFERLKREDH